MVEAITPPFATGLLVQCSFSLQRACWNHSLPGKDRCGGASPPLQSLPIPLPESSGTESSRNTRLYCPSAAAFHDKEPLLSALYHQPLGKGRFTRRGNGTTPLQRVHDSITKILVTLRGTGSSQQCFFASIQKSKYFPFYFADTEYSATFLPGSMRCWRCRIRRTFFLSQRVAGWATLRARKPPLPCLKETCPRGESLHSSPGRKKAEMRRNRAQE